MRKNESIRLTESAIMLAFAVVLSMIKIVDLPYGGSITACSMLPILIIAYRYGTAWGLLTAGVFSLLQLVIGSSALSYATGVIPAIAIILLDYVVAYMVLGLGGMFRKVFSSQGTALAAGALVTGLLRYLSHVIVGCTVWAGLSIPTEQALIYSIAYNGTYMIPETIILVLGAVYISKVLDFRHENITRVAAKQRRPDLAILFSGIAKTALLAAAVWDIKEIALPLQNGETGDFDITGITQVNWLSVGLATGICVVLALLFFAAASKVPADNSLNLQPLFTAIPFVAIGAAAVADVFFIRYILQEDNNIYGWLQIAVLTAAVAAALVLFTLRQMKRHKSQKGAAPSQP